MDAEASPKTVAVKVPSKLSLIFLLLLLLVTLIALVLLIGLLTKGFGAWEEKVCQTAECVQSAARIARHMDRTADPCNDFYACGGYEKSTFIPHDSQSVSPTQSMTDDLLKEQKFLLESKSKLDSLRVVNQAKKFYKSCMNETHMEKLGIEPLKNYVKSKGGWALLDDNWKDAEFSVENYIASLAPGINNPPFVSQWIVQNPQNSSESILFIGQGMYPYLNRMTVNKTESLTKYESILTSIGVALGGDATKLKPKVQKMIEFEKMLVNITIPFSERDFQNQKILTLENVTIKYNNGLDFEKLINGYLKRQMKKTEHIGLVDEAYLQKVGPLVAKTSKQTLASYIMWCSIDLLIPYTDQKTKSLRYPDSRRAKRPRYKQCAAATNSHFPHVMARLFADKIMNYGTSDIEDITKRVKSVFKSSLEKIDWLDAATNKLAVEKLNRMAEKLAYPKFIMNNSALEQEIADMETLQTDQYFWNNFKMNVYKFRNQMKKANRPVDNSEWPVQPVVVNAFYNPLANLIVIPVGILQPPFYDIGGPKAINYGAIGVVIGHELTHGFDSQGRHFDKDGNKRDWWTDESDENFLKRSECVRNQYDNIPVTAINTTVDGNRTLGENIADIGAIKHSFEAYQNWVEENGEERRLPGLNLSSNELFFLGFAQVHCHRSTLKGIRESTRGVHTPGKQRIFGSVINSEDFGRVYKCPVGSRMNPEHKCTVW